MQLKEKFYTILKEARLYASQGLFDEARVRYREMEELIRAAKHLKNRDALLADISRKIAELDQRVSEIAAIESDRQFSALESDLVSSLMEDKSTEPPATRLENARVLARFGSYPSAIPMFTALLETASVSEQAADGLVTALVHSGDPEKAGEQIREWEERGQYREETLARLRQILPVASDAALGETEELAEDDMDIMPVSSVSIRLENVPESRRDQVELDVSFQSGNLVSLIISSKDKTLIDNLKVGLKLNDMHCYSPVAVFKSSGVVASKHQIDSGPKKGDWCLDIEIKKS